MIPLTIVGAEDHDWVRFHADDGFHVFREDHDVRVRLLEDSTLLELCIARRPTDGPPSRLRQHHLGMPTERQARWRGSWGREDAADYVVQVRQRPGFEACTRARLVVSNGG
ncbi:MAG: hypothetical protein HC923_02555 [Myxococcales bacterium]|nr:hypothetical protein [Myxococcales bacterium]